MNQQAAQRHFYSLSPFDNLDKSEFRVQKIAILDIAILDTYLR